MASLALEKPPQPLVSCSNRGRSPQDEHWLDEGDLSQIRDMLALTPEERLRSIQESLNSAIELRNVLLKREEPYVDFFASLEVLARHQVELIVVDDVAAVLVGAPIMSRDLDLLYRPTARNQARLRCALRELDAYSEDEADIAHLSNEKERSRSSWMTRFGPIHTRYRIGEETYSSLIGSSDEHRIAGHLIHTLSLTDQISIREQAQRLLDEYVLIFLWNVFKLKATTELVSHRQTSSITLVG